MLVPCYRQDTCTYIEFINAIICAVNCCNIKNEKLYIAMAETLQCGEIAMQQDCRNIATQTHNKIAGTLQCINVAMQQMVQH